MTKSYIITVKDDCSDADFQKIKDDVKAAGGKITQEYTIFKGFATDLPDFHVSTIKDHPQVQDVEVDKEMKTQ